MCPAPLLRLSQPFTYVYAAGTKFETNKISISIFCVYDCLSIAQKLTITKKVTLVPKPKQDVPCTVPFPHQFRTDQSSTDVYKLDFSYISITIFNIKSHQVTKRFTHGDRHFQKIYGGSEIISKFIIGP